MPEDQDAAGDSDAEMESTWEISLHVVLLGGGVIERARHDGNNTVRDAQRLVVVLRRRDHFLEHLPRLVVVGRGDAELLDLLKLMHAEDAEGVAAVRAHLE